MTANSTVPLELLFLGNSPTWQNPSLTGINRLAPHATLFPFADEQSAYAGDITASPWVTSLSGTWQFSLLANPAATTPAAIATTAWYEIHVPSLWTMLGFERPQYLNIRMPFDNTPPEVPADNPVGVYRRSMTVPSAWVNRRVIIHFAGVEGMLCVYVDGRAVGMS